MNILLFENKKDNKWLSNRLYRLLPEHKFTVEEISENLTPSYYFDILYQLREHKQKIDLFLIPVCLIGTHTEFLGLKLGVLIRLAFEHTRYCLKPIIFIGADKKDELLKYSSFANILNTKGTFYNRYSLEKLKNSLDNIETFSNEEIIESMLDNLRFEKPPFTGRHSIANEWAIYRMAYYLACLKSIEKNNLFSVIIHNPYFRFLLNQLHYNKSNKLLDINNLFPINKFENSKFLLIDDKADIGWQKVLEVLIEKLNPKNLVFTISKFPAEETKFKENIGQIIKQIEVNDYDMIFLDLRLKSSEEDKSFKNISDVESFSGAKILKEIKQKFPAMPVIMFTASQQAWNMEHLYDLGADGYFIKESPENIFSDEIFYDNLKTFINNIVTLVDKGRELKWFYNNSQKLKTYLDQINLRPNIARRIKQKLDLSFGIIRANRREYDKQFIYSDYQFAFLVYWSILIEFQAEKIGYYNGRDSSFSFVNGTKLIDTDKTLIQRTYSSLPSSKWSLRFRSIKMPNLSKRTLHLAITSPEKAYFKNLSILIPSFVLLEYGTTYSAMIDDFIFLNQVRNNLDYTHSDSSIVANEPIHTQANEAEDLSLTKDMFKFIYFLFTKDLIQ